MKKKRNVRIHRRPRKQFGLFSRLRPFVMALALLFSAALLVENSYAWLTVNDKRDTNVMLKQMQFRVDLQENYTAPSPARPGGPTVDKKVTAKNNGGLPALVRMRAVPILAAANGALLEARFSGQLEFDGLNTSDWKPGADGWYYYKTVLDPGRTTAELFTGVKLLSTLPSGGKLSVVVLIESVDNASTHYVAAGWQPPAGMSW